MSNDPAAGGDLHTDAILGCVQIRSSPAELSNLGNIILFKFAPSPRNGQIREGELPIFSKFPFFSLRHLVIQIFGTFSAFGHFSEPVVHRGGSFARYVHCLFNRKLFIRRPYYLFSVGVGGGKLFFTGGHVE